MKVYVINLISRGMSYNNDYGYWTGKSYVFQGEYFPINTGNKITNDTKKYKSKARAEIAAKKCYLRYGSVNDVIVTEVEYEQ